MNETEKEKSVLKKTAKYKGKYYARRI